MEQTQAQKEATYKAAGLTLPASSPSVEPTIDASTLSSGGMDLSLRPKPFLETPDIMGLSASFETPTGTGLPTSTLPDTTSGAYIDRAASLYSAGRNKEQDLTTEISTATEPFNKQLNEINSQIKMHQATSLARQEKALQYGDTLSSAAGEADRVQRTDAIESLKLAAIAEGLRGNIALAEQHATNAINTKYAQIEKDMEDARANIYENYDSFTPAQKKKADATLLRIDKDDAFVKDKKEDDKITQGFIQEAIVQSNKNGTPIPTLALNRASAAESPTEALKILGPYMVDVAAKEAALADLEYKRSQTAKNNADILQMGGTIGETVNIPGMGQVNANAAALAQQYASTGKLPSASELEAAGTSYAEIARIAKESPKFEGAVVDKNTGITSSTLPAGASEDFSRLFNIVKAIDGLAAIDKKRQGGIVNGVLGTIFGKSNQGEIQNEYLTKRKSIVDELARMQSGAALTPDEVAFYQEYLPGRFSEAFYLGQDSGKQIQNFKNEMNNKLNSRLSNNNLAIYGYSKVNIGGKEYKVGDTISNGTSKGRVNPDGTITVEGGSNTSGQTSMNRPNRNNNPLNIKSSSVTKSYPGVSGVDKSPAADGGNFLTFATPEDGFKAAERLITSQNYKDLSVDAALKRWSNSGYGGEIVPEIKGKKVSQLSRVELDKLLKTMAKREGYNA